LDSTTNSNDGTILGGSFDSGKLDLAYKALDGGSLITVPDNDSLDLTEFSFSTWVKVDSLNSSNMPIIWKGRASVGWLELRCTHPHFSFK